MIKNSENHEFHTRVTTFVARYQMTHTPMARGLATAALQYSITAVGLDHHINKIEWKKMHSGLSVLPINTPNK